MRGTGVVVAGLVLALATSCAAAGGTTTPSSSAVPRGIPPCTDLYADGTVIENGTFGEACVDDAGVLLAPIPVRIECEDGRVLVWNDLAWGYRDEPMTLTPEDDPKKVPPDVLSACLTNGEPES